MARPEGDTRWSPSSFLLSPILPLLHVQFVNLYNIENYSLCTILGNYSLLFVTKLQRISHFKFEFFLLSSNFLMPPFYPTIRIILVPPLSSVNLRRERSQRGLGLGGAWVPSVRNPSPLSPQMKGITLSTGVYGEPPVWVQVSPRPRWRPVILKRLTTPQLMSQIKTSLSLNMDIRDKLLLSRSTIFKVYLLYITCKPLRGDNCMLLAHRP